MTAGRPRVPLEQRLLEAKGGNQDAGHRPVKDIVQYEPSPYVMEKPADLKKRGSEEWDIIWEAGKLWLHTAEDYFFIEQICYALDDIDRFRRQVKKDGLMVKGYNGQVVANPLLKEIRVAEQTVRKCLAEIGFGPSARAKLGFAQVKEARGLAKLQNETKEHRDKALTSDETPVIEDWGTTTTTATQV